MSYFETSIAHNFLHSIGYPSSKIEQVKQCIVATQMPQNPSSLVEELLCDADLHHLGKPDFQKYTELLRLEFEGIEKRSIPDDD